MIWIVLALCLLAALYAFLICPAQADEKARGVLEGRSYAHRGYHRKDLSVPENSMAAFEAAAVRGYGMELDVRLSADGQVVVFHDDTLERVCGVEGSVISKSWEELSQLRLHGTEERIPLFSQLLRQIDGRVPLVVELKAGGDRDTLCRLVYEQLHAYDGVYCIESFDPRIVAWFHKHAPEVVRGQLASNQMKNAHLPLYQRIALSNLLMNWMGRPHFIAYQYSGYQNPAFRLCTRMFGAMPVVWTVRSRSDFDTMIQEGITTQIFEFFDAPAVVKTDTAQVKGG